MMVILNSKRLLLDKNAQKFNLIRYYDEKGGYKTSSTPLVFYNMCEQLFPIVYSPATVGPILPAPPPPRPQIKYIYSKF